MIQAVLNQNAGSTKESNLISSLFTRFTSRNSPKPNCNPRFSFQNLVLHHSNHAPSSPISGNQSMHYLHQVSKGVSSFRCIPPTPPTPRHHLLMLNLFFWSSLCSMTHPCLRDMPELYLYFRRYKTVWNNLGFVPDLYDHPAQLSAEDGHRFLWSFLSPSIIRLIRNPAISGGGILSSEVWVD